MARRGRISPKWGHYDSRSDVHVGRRVSFEDSTDLIERDGMCDYIEEAEWWIARSEKSVRQIFRAFDRGEAACCLYERTGAIVELGHTGQQYLIAIQLVRTGRD